MSARKPACDPVEDGALRGPHRPLQPARAEAMEAAMLELQRRFPDLVLSLFVYEPPHDGAEGIFSYISSGSRADMTTVLRAFVKRGERDAVADRIVETPPTRSRQ